MLTKLAEIKSDCEKSICELNDRQVLQNTQDSMENIGQQSLLVSRKDTVIPAEEYTAIMTKLEVCIS